MKIELELCSEIAAYLVVLGSSAVAPGAGGVRECVTVQEVICKLIACAREGVSRPGGWERGWAEEAFGPIDETRLVRDPVHPHLMKVKAA